MKILFCTNVFEVVENGPVKFAHLLLQINERYPEHELSILTEDVTIPRPHVHKVPIAGFLRNSPFSQFVRMEAYHRAAMRLRATFPFDVLVYNNALVGLWSACRFANTVGMINDDNNLSSSLWPSKSPALKQPVFGVIEGLMARKSRKIIVNSEYLRGMVCKRYRIPASRVHRLYKAVEPPPAGLSPYPWPADTTSPIRGLFVKNDYRRGGLTTLIEALSRLPYRFVLTIVGPNASDREHIMSLLKGTSNTEGIFLGKLPQSSVARLLQETHFFCVPSYREALGVANMEAMARGVPVISTNAGGIPEVLDHGRCGWLVPPHDAAALARAIDSCISRPDLRAARVANACEQVLRFNPQAMFENFLKILAH